MTVGASTDVPRRATVRVPATSANLGPGFDSLALCLALYDEVTATIDPQCNGCAIEVVGEGSGGVPLDDSHIVLATLRRAWREWGVVSSGSDHPAVSLHCRNAIPHARGLGSSAAAIVAGLLLATELAPESSRGHLPAREDLFALASGIEGHADNVAACLFGGATLTWDDGGPRALRLPISDALRPLVLIAPEGLVTRTSRDVLPEQVPLTSASFNAARTALLTQALSTRPDLLLAATADRLHQPARQPLMPATLELVSALRADGIAATVSGAGPSVLCLLGDGAVPHATIARLLPPKWRILSTTVDDMGARVVERVAAT